MSDELTFAGSGVEIERAIDLTGPNSPNAKRGDAILFEVVREVTEQDADNGKAHPLEVKAWVLDGPDAGTFDEGLWVFASGIRTKLNKNPGAYSAGRLEVYKAYGSPKIGLTNMTEEQMEKASAKVKELKAGGGETAPATSADRPPF